MIYCLFKWGGSKWNEERIQTLEECPITEFAVIWQNMFSNRNPPYRRWSPAAWASEGGQRSRSPPEFSYTISLMCLSTSTRFVKTSQLSVAYAGISKGRSQRRKSFENPTWGPGAKPLEAGGLEAELPAAGGYGGRGAAAEEKFAI